VRGESCGCIDALGGETILIRCGVGGMPLCDPGETLPDKFESP